MKIFAISRYVRRCYLAKRRSWRNTGKQKCEIVWKNIDNLIIGLAQSKAERLFGSFATKSFNKSSQILCQDHSKTNKTFGRKLQNEKRMITIPDLWGYVSCYNADDVEVQKISIVDHFLQTVTWESTGSNPFSQRFARIQLPERSSGKENPLAVFARTRLQERSRSQACPHWPRKTKWR